MTLGMAQFIAADIAQFIAAGMATPRFGGNVAADMPTTDDAGNGDLITSVGITQTMTLDAATPMAPDIPQFIMVGMAAIHDGVTALSFQ